jgi:hypothetical protein
MLSVGLQDSWDVDLQVLRVVFAGHWQLRLSVDEL